MTDKFRIDDGAAWVGDRRMPESAKVNVMDIKQAHPTEDLVFEMHSRGFDLPFENGWTVSVIWGSGGRFPKSEVFEEEAETANVTITNRDGRVVVWDDAGAPLGKSMDHPGVRVDIPAAEALRVIDKVATWSSDELQIIDRI